MRSPPPLRVTLVLLLAAWPLSAGGQEPPPPALAGPVDSALTAKLDREAAKRSAKEAERIRKEAEESAPARVVVAPLPRAHRLTMNVVAFRYGTVINQANYRLTLPRGATRATVITDPAALAHEDNQNIGTGVAELVKAELTSGQSFRILDRLPVGDAPENLALSERAEPLDSAPLPRRKTPRPQLTVTGSITRFGGEDRTIGGGGLLKKALGGIGLSRKRTVVELTAQVLDAATGEVLLSITGFGVSRKGGGLVAVGGTKDGVVGIGTGKTNVTSEAIGEATRLAAQDLAAKITNARDELLGALADTVPVDGPTTPKALPRGDWARFFQALAIL